MSVPVSAIQHSPVLPSDWYSWLILGLIAVALGWGWWLIWRAKNGRVGRRSLLIIGVIQLADLAWLYGRWYYDLHKTKINAQLLPPHSLYYLGHLNTAITSLAVSWLTALVLFWVLYRFFIVRHHGTFLDQVDIALLVLGTAALGWPAVFLFLAAVFLVSVLAMLVLVVLRKRGINDRLVITPYIIPTAIVILFMRDWLLQVTHLWKIGF